MNETPAGIVYVIVLNWNNAADTIECLASIFKLQTHNFKLIICDNASSDDSVKVIKEWLANHNHPVTELDESALETAMAAEATLIRNHRNYGYAGGNNRGLSYALSVGGLNDFAWIVNNDTAFDPQALQALLAAAAKRPEISFFGSTILDYRERDVIQTQGGDQFYPLFGLSQSIGRGRTLATQLPAGTVEARISYIVGASVFVRLSAVKKIGSMEERYFLYFEEIDWATRARRQGLKLGYVPESLVYHQEGGTIGSHSRAAQKNLISDYYGVKNRIVMTRRLFPWALPTVYLAMLFTLIKRLVSGQFDRAWMVIKIMLGFNHRPIQPS